MTRHAIGLAMATLAMTLAASVSAIMAMPPIMVGPPQRPFTEHCPVTVERLDGAGPGAAVPFPALALGAPVTRTANSFITGGGGTSNAAIEADRRAKGLPWQPPRVNPASTVPPLTFAVERGASMTAAPYQRLPLTASKRLAEPDGLIFSQATSATRGRIAALVLYLAGRPIATPRVRVTIHGAAAQGCQRQVIHVYAPSTPAATLAQLFATPGRACSWASLAACTRAQWPRGRVLFVAQSYGTAFEYRWVDYDMLAAWHFAPRRNR